jgi:hypothetical protein
VSTPIPKTRSSRSLYTLVLLFIAILLTVIAAFVGITTALGFAHADVRGHRLTGALEGLFLAALAVAALGGGAATIGLWRRRAWAVPALAAIWPGFAIVCLVLDRVTPVPGPGRPLWFYLVAIGLLPAAATVLLGLGRRADERKGEPVNR